MISFVEGEEPIKNSRRVYMRQGETSNDLARKRTQKCILLSTMMIMGKAKFVFSVEMKDWT